MVAIDTPQIEDNGIRPCENLWSSLPNSQTLTSEGASRKGDEIAC